jgi:hypothetical protein
MPGNKNIFLLLFTALGQQHVNLQGEYDFRRIAANDDSFDMGQILALRLA